MSILLAALFVALPLNALGRVVGGSLITPADVMGAVIAIVTIARLATHRYVIRPSLDQSILAFVIFLVLATISVIFSRDVGQIFAKGFVQIVGISIMVLVCIAMVNEISRRPVLFTDYLRLSAMVLAVAALIGVAQFVAANVFGHYELLGFAFLNDWSGANVWYNHGSLDGIVRANSILQEPSALGMVLGLGAGASLIRLGLMGGVHRERIRAIIPAWAAVLVLAGFVVTISMLDFLLLFIVAASLRLVSQRINGKTIAALSCSLALLAGVAYAAISAAMPDLREKLGSLGSITSDEIRIEHAEDLSAIALAVNLAVMRTNLIEAPMLGAGLGAHPVTYDRENPGLGRLPAEIVTVGMNKEDAASLLVRLLSESGILGTLAFVTGWILTVTRARRFILASFHVRPRPDAFLSLAIGVTASTLGVGIACLVRAPQYYALWLWLPIALTASVPELLARLRLENSEGQSV